MKRILALGLCLALLCPAARAAEEAKGWSRSEPGGDYVTLRVPCPQGEALDWSEQTLPRGAVRRHGGAGAPHQRLPAGLALRHRPSGGGGAAPGGLSGGGAPLPRLHHGLEGARVLQRPRRRKGAVSPGSAPGDHAGNLNPDAAPDAGGRPSPLICRLLSLEPGGDPGYADAEPGDWYYDTASAARAGGLAAEDAYFHPDRLVTRGELTVMAARAMEAVGWLTIPEGERRRS